MIKWEGDGMKQSLPNQELSPHLTTGTKKNHKRILSEQTVSHKIQTGQLHITDLVCYHQRNPFSSIHFL